MYKKRVLGWIASHWGAISVADVADVADVAIWAAGSAMSGSNIAIWGADVDFWGDVVAIL